MEIKTKDGAFVTPVAFLGIDQCETTRTVVVIERRPNNTFEVVLIEQERRGGAQ